MLAHLAFTAPSNAQTVTVERVPLDTEDPRRDRVGGLIWRGGLEITVRDDRFGGLSGLHVSPDGRRMTAVSDRGHWVTARLKYRNGELVDLDRLKIDVLKQPNGAGVKGRRRDAEAIAATGNGGLLVAFERRHRIVEYAGDKNSPFGGKVRRLGFPATARLPYNEGLEALTRLCDGRLFALSEGQRVGTHSLRGWIGDGREWRDFDYIYRTDADLDFRPTGATTLDNCDVLLVERFFGLPGGVRARITRVPGDRIIPGASLRGETVATLGPPLTVDNMEGIAARRGGAGETLVYLISDDNFSGFQRTLLMMFELAAAR